MLMPVLIMKDSFGPVGIQPHGLKELVKQQANDLLESMQVACTPEHREEVQVLQMKITYVLRSGPGNYAQAIYLVLVIPVLAVTR